MNYKKKNYVNIDGVLYNLDNWSRLSVEKRLINGEQTPCLIIELPGSSKILYLTAEQVLNSTYHMVFGISREDLESMFLEFEVKD